MTTKLPLLAALLLAASAAVAADAPAPGARLLAAVGDVTIQSKSGGRLGKAGAAIAEGEEVVTAAKATAVIELPDGSRLKLRESGRLAVTLPTEKSPITDISLTLGSVFAKVRKQLVGRSFRVRTDTAVAAVRGTEFFTAYGNPTPSGRDLWVCVNEGAVDVATTKSKKALGIPAGKGVLIKSGLDLTKPQSYDWTKALNWNMDSEAGELEDKTNLEAAYTDLLNQDYR